MRFVMNIPTRPLQKLTGDPDAAAGLTSMVARQLLDATVTQNRILMRLARMHGRPFPPLYQSRVIYKPEPNPNTLANVAEVYARGWGDCKHLVCIRLAELAEIGHEAHPVIYWRLTDDGEPYIFHAELRHGPRNGRGPREDPSRYKGM